MKEERYFYDPMLTGELPEEEARHALRVLRLQMGDEFFLMDGDGCYHRAEITVAAGHRCQYRIIERHRQEKAWEGRVHLAMAPTKMNERTEWMAEKATEIGIDELTLLNCQFSERRVMKTERVERILVSAMKQSRKAWKPRLNGMTDFEHFVKEAKEEDKFICHCYDPHDINGGAEKPFLGDVLRRGRTTVVMVGPEGDFSVEEVRMAEELGFRSVSLGRSRLRTETAALVAVHLMQITNQIR